MANRNLTAAELDNRISNEADIVLVRPRQLQGFRLASQFDSLRARRRRVFMALPRFPGPVIKRGDQGRATVRRIQRRLNARGCGPIDVNGIFGKDTERAVKLFQARFPDVEGQPLVVDGKIGSITWAALFGLESVPFRDLASSPLLAKTISVAKSQIGVMEQPPGSNRGPEVDKYVQSVGLDPSGRFADQGGDFIEAEAAAGADGHVRQILHGFRRRDAAVWCPGSIGPRRTRVSECSSVIRAEDMDSAFLLGTLDAR